MSRPRQPDDPVIDGLLSIGRDVPELGDGWGWDWEIDPRAGAAIDEIRHLRGALAAAHNIIEGLTRDIGLRSRLSEFG